jgi:hypothetical protein
VSGGLPVIDHVHPAQTHGDEGCAAQSWSVNDDPQTSRVRAALPRITPPHQ